LVLVATVEEVIVRFTLQDNLSPQARRARAEVEALERALQRLGATNVGPHINGITGSVVGLNSALGIAVRGGVAFTNWLGREVVSASQSAIFALSGAGAAAAAFGLKAEAGYERARVAFNALAGAQRGPGLFQFARQYNLSTVFTQEQVNAVTQLGLASGVPVDNIESLVRASGNLAAASGDFNKITSIGRVLGQIQSAGKLYAQDVNQLNAANVPVLPILSENLGEPLSGLRQRLSSGQLEVSADDFLSWIANSSGPTLQGRVGLAEKMNQTLSGAYSTAIDSVRQALADQAEPYTDVMVPKIRAVSEQVQELVRAVGPDLFHLVDALISFASEAIPVIQPAAEAFFGGLAMIADTPYDRSVLAALGNETGKAISEFFVAIEPRMPTLVDAFVNLAYLAPAFIDALTATIPLVDPLVELFNAMASTEIGRNLAGFALLLSATGSGVNNVTGGAFGSLTQYLLLSRLLGGGAAGGAGGAGAAAGAFLRYGGAAALGLGGGITAYQGFNTEASDQSWGSAAKTIGGLAATGASFGLLGGPFAELTVPGGAAIGAGIGTVLEGAKWLFGDHGGSKQQLQLPPSASGSADLPEWARGKVVIVQPGAFQGVAPDQQQSIEETLHTIVNNNQLRQGN
jgi:tape measure domain-containing protein